MTEQPQKGGDLRMPTSATEAITEAESTTPSDQYGSIDSNEKHKTIVPQDDIDPTVEIRETPIEDSPYEEVRAAVRPIDNQEPANTIRAWVLGIFFITVASAINMLLSMRYPAINFPAVVVQLLVYPTGCLWAKTMPTRSYSKFLGIRCNWTLNPGPFNIKEHVVITIMANVSIIYAYTTNALLAMQGKPFYDIDLGWGFALLFTLSAQLIGCALAGMFRRFLVWPAAMIWPNQFSNTTLFYALHDKRKSDGSAANGWTISRYRYFFVVLCAMFVYYWIPAVLFQGLSVFAFPTWIKPDNVVVNQLFGGFTGLSLIPITFDWTYVSAYLGDPLLSPTHAHVNTLIGLVVFVVLTTIGITYKGALYAEYIPMVTSQTYDNAQQAYNVSRIITTDGTFSFDPERYKAYSPLFLPVTLALNYGLSFAALTASLVHVSLFHGREIWYRYKTARNQAPDVHLRLMQKYVETPDWWYVALLAVSLALGLATVLAYEGSQTPWWAFFVSNILAFIFIIPTCMILGISNIQLSLNVLSPFLGGFMLPGKPVAVMIFKVFATSTLGEAQRFAGDMKLAHYMKVPPRVTFWCQVVAVCWTCFVQIAVMNWTLANIPRVCENDQPSHFTCPNGRAFFSSSIVWGLIGPQRMFGPGSLYVHFNQCGQQLNSI